MSSLLLEELERTLNRDRLARRTGVNAPLLLARLREEADWHVDPGHAGIAIRDANDAYLVALADAAGADAIVTGDRDLLEMPAPPVAIMTPRAALDAIRPS